MCSSSTDDCPWSSGDEVSAVESRSVSVDPASKMSDPSSELGVSSRYTDSYDEY